MNKDDLQKKNPIDLIPQKKNSRVTKKNINIFLLSFIKTSLRYDITVPSLLSKEKKDWENIWEKEEYYLLETSHLMNNLEHHWVTYCASLSCYQHFLLFFLCGSLLPSHHPQTASASTPWHRSDWADLRTSQIFAFVLCVCQFGQLRKK